MSSQSPLFLFHWSYTPASKYRSSTVACAGLRNWLGWVLINFGVSVMITQGRPQSHDDIAQMADILRVPTMITKLLHPELNDGGEALLGTSHVYTQRIGFRALVRLGNSGSKVAQLGDDVRLVRARVEGKVGRKIVEVGGDLAKADDTLVSYGSDPVIEGLAWLPRL